MTGKGKETKRRRYCTTSIGKVTKKEQEVKEREVDGERLTFGRLMGWKRNSEEHWKEGRGGGKGRGEDKGGERVVTA